MTEARPWILHIRTYQQHFQTKIKGKEVKRRIHYPPSLDAGKLHIIIIINSVFTILHLAHRPWLLVNTKVVGNYIYPLPFLKQRGATYDGMRENNLHCATLVSPVSNYTPQALACPFVQLPTKYAQLFQQWPKERLLKCSAPMRPTMYKQAHHHTAILNG